MGEGGDHVLDSVADGVGVLVVHLPGVADKAVCLLLMDRSCMFSPKRKRFYFLPMIYFHFFTLQHHTQFVSRYRYPCLRRICLLICLACMFAEASPARQMFWRASTHSHTPKSLSVAACKHTAEVFSTLANHLMKCRGGQKWCHFSRRSVGQKRQLL